MSYDGQDPTTANISELAAMFGVGRQRVRNSIEKGCVKITGEYKGNNQFRIADVAKIMFGSSTYLEGEVDPRTLSPSERKDYWIAEQKEVDHKVSIRTYISAEEVRSDYKQLQDNLKEKIQSFPDILERDDGLGAQEIERMISLCDRLQITLYEAWNE